eukprot:310839-Pleurochrysis_carterae.AAC.1
MVSGRHAPSARVSRAAKYRDRLARTELMRVAQASHASGFEPSGPPPRCAGADGSSMSGSEGGHAT